MAALISFFIFFLLSGGLIFAPFGRAFIPAGFSGTTDRDYIRKYGALIAGLYFSVPRSKDKKYNRKY